MTLLINQDGVIAPTATVSVLDRGFLYGDSIYEVVRTFAGKTFGLQEHLDRLRQSAAYLYMNVPWSDSHIQQEVNRTLDQAGPGEYYIRIVVSRGVESRISLLPTQSIQPSLTVIVAAIDPEPILSETGIHLAVVQRLRNDSRALDPAAKTGNYLNNILALLEARQHGAEDALLLNSAGEVSEATTSNIWVVQEGMVKTPPVEAGILHGITRHFLLKILRDNNIPHREVSLQPADLWSAEEAFLSSSVRLLMPVRCIDDFTLPACPGPITRLLWEELINLMKEMP
uniref:Aminotransferase class IV n=1 Tax=Cyanothece sp. (strain PCC 7425 / ATCC 29141) TaxID=395961 RepID=B8HY42_CYAP4